MKNYIIKENNLYCVDALDGLRSMEDRSVDMVLTSPPYNFGMNYQKYDDRLDWDVYFNQLELILNECFRVLVVGGRICIVVQPLFSSYKPTHHIISNILSKIGFLWKAEILWDKHNYNAKYTSWGSWKSASMPYLKYTWEFIEVFCKESQKKVRGLKKDTITGEEFKKYVLAKWDVAPEKNMKLYKHPAMFPVEICSRLIKLFSYEGDLVLDPFVGVGTSAVACKNLNRKYIGFDVSNEYIETANLRLGHD